MFYLGLRAGASPQAIILWAFSPRITTMSSAQKSCRLLQLQDRSCYSQGLLGRVTPLGGGGRLPSSDGREFCNPGRGKLHFQQPLSVAGTFSLQTGHDQVAASSRRARRAGKSSASRDSEYCAGSSSRASTCL